MTASTAGLRPWEEPEEVEVVEKAAPKPEYHANALHYILLTIGAAVVLIPFYYMVATSLTESSKLYAYPFDWIPSPIAYWNYPDAFAAMSSIAPGLTFWRVLGNTLFITLLGVAAEIAAVAVVAYGFARFDFPGRRVLFLLLLATMMLPGVVTLIPVFSIWVRLNLIDKYDPLVLGAWFGGGAWGIFLLRQFFMGLPKEVDEAAAVDGANILQILLRINLPLMRPALLSLGLLVFVGRWNDFQGPLIYLYTTIKYPLVLAMKFFEESLSKEAPKWNYMMAISVVMTVPLMVLYFLAQKSFIEGLTAGAVKG
jgi:multiple sugar transport system permease protein